MSLADQFAADVAVFLNSNEFAETVTYTPAGGQARSIVAVVERDSLEDEFDKTDRISIGSATVWISLSASNGIASPREMDTVTMPRYGGGSDQITWVVVKVGQPDGGMAALRVEEQARDIHRARNARS